MERQKKLIEEIRENARLIQTKVEALHEEGVEIAIEVGTNQKTVLFSDVEHIEIIIRASVKTDL